MHLILASQGVSRSQTAVAPQLLDFAARHTAAVLQDAVLYGQHTEIMPEDIKLALAQRALTQGQPVAPRKHLVELAAQRNAKQLPAVVPVWGVRLPPERYCLTNTLDEEE